MLYFLILLIGFVSYFLLVSLFDFLGFWNDVGPDDITKEFYSILLSLMLMFVSGFIMLSNRENKYRKKREDEQRIKDASEEKSKKEREENIMMLVPKIKSKFPNETKDNNKDYKKIASKLYDKNISERELDQVILICKDPKIISKYSSSSQKKKEQIKMILEKYESKIAADIINGEIWIGEQKEMLIESIGLPIQKDIKELKTKTKEVWKYKQITKNQFGLKIFLENDIVVSIEEKQ